MKRRLMLYAAMGVFWGLCMSLFSSATFPGQFVIWLAGGLLFAVLFGGFFELYFRWLEYSPMLRKQAAIPLKDGETILFSTAANFGSRGGRLYLLPDRLEFKSHRFGYGQSHISIPVDRIASVEVSSSYGFYGFLKSTMEIRCLDGSVNTFTVGELTEWKEKMEEVLHLAHGREELTGPEGMGG